MWQLDSDGDEGLLRIDRVRRANRAAARSSGEEEAGTSTPPSKRQTWPRL